MIIVKGWDDDWKCDKDKHTATHIPSGIYVVRKKMFSFGKKEGVALEGFRLFHPNVPNDVTSYRELLEKIGVENHAALLEIRREAAELIRQGKF